MVHVFGLEHFFWQNEIQSNIKGPMKTTSSWTTENSCTKKIEEKQFEQTGSVLVDQASVCVAQPFDPGLRVLKGLEFLSEPEISCRKAAMCKSFSDFLPSKMTTRVKCGSGRVR